MKNTKLAIAALLQTLSELNTNSGWALDEIKCLAKASTGRFIGRTMLNNFMKTALRSNPVFETVCFHLKNTNKPSGFIKIYMVLNSESLDIDDIFSTHAYCGINTAAIYERRIKNQELDNHVMSLLTGFLEV